jgi:signal transduction histidine kinase
LHPIAAAPIRDGVSSLDPTVASLPGVLERDGARPEADALVDALRALATARDLPAVMAAVRRGARRLAGADGATFVLREGALVHYADEDAIGPLWKGRRFPASACISGWAMIHRQSVGIEDIYADPRIPADAYRPTFVRSLAMVPIRREDPVGAIGVYWASRHRVTSRQLAMLEALASGAAVAVANAELRATMERAIRLRDDFLTLAAHELNTPLTAVRLRAGALARAQPPDGAAEGRAAELERLQSALERLGETVQGLLEFARLDGQGIRLAPEAVDLVEVARAVADAVRARADATGTELRLDAPAAVAGRWDGARLGQAIRHLVENALKFGRGRPVEVTVLQAQGEARVVVRDRGPGVPAGDRERIFGKFERACSPDHVGGLGLGLWMARAIAEAHGGTVTVGSEPGGGEGGATFTLSVPARLAL